jgi:hypothetical protein
VVVTALLHSLSCIHWYHRNWCSNAFLLLASCCSRCITTTTGYCTVYYIQFFALLGPIQTILQNNMRLRILKSVPLLAKLTDTELCSVADALCVQSFEDQDYVIRQGEEV